MIRNLDGQPARTGGCGENMIERHHGPEPATSGHRPEPSWPTVLATTARLWFERHTSPRKRLVSRKRGGRRLAVIVLCVLVAAAAGAGVTWLTTRQAPPPASRAGNPSAGNPSAGNTTALQMAVANRHDAAVWIAQQVSPSVIVSCDPEMCSELQASGFPAGQLMVLPPTAPDPLGSTLVVATPAVRNQFGTRLTSVYAPLVMASFGTGTERVDVRAVAPDGTSAFEATLASARNVRMSQGKQLLGNKHVQASPSARAALLAGQVDPRLLITLSALAAQLPLRLIIFDDPSPGASPDVPLRGAEIGSAASADLTTMLAFLNAQRPPYQPAVARIAKSAGGQSVVTVRFDAVGLMGLPGP
jgi:hypothetical protein